MRLTCTANDLKSTSSDCARPDAGATTTASAAQPRVKTLVPKVMAPPAWHHLREPISVTAVEKRAERTFAPAAFGQWSYPGKIYLSRRSGDKNMFDHGVTLAAPQSAALDRALDAGSRPADRGRSSVGGRGPPRHRLRAACLGLKFPYTDVRQLPPVEGRAQPVAAGVSVRVARYEPAEIYLSQLKI